MKIIYSILIAYTAFTACAKKRPHHTAVNMNHKDSTINTQGNALHYLALGDSYTIGEAVPADQSYPNLLTSELSAQKHPVSSPTIIAVTGWTTDDLINAISQAGLTGKKYDIVTLLVGVNDQYQQLSQDNYKIKFTQVLNTAISFAGGNKTHVFVLSIPDWGVTPFAAGQGSVISPQIDQFNTINKQISTAAGVNYLDITPISRKAANDPGLVAGDGLHPSAKMYRDWVKLLEPLVVAKLNLK
jgi:lysophospholipase L1-like esterase